MPPPPVTLLLARKLKLLADSKNSKLSSEAGEILKEHARYIELMQLRVDGLEAGIVGRDRQISKHIQSTFIGLQLLQIKTVFKVLPYALPMYGGYRGLIKRIWRAYKDEGIEGIKRRYFVWCTGFHN